ncbi:gluconeogenesis factor YvcK family protein [Pseudonocardia parietis]|uniref:Putative gluconeogenesis factor n=1 Tax=Pseudonocardia parietis TaxID=570936 RepID=A0ABS4VXI1_9PSEU|nr:uridine diphosphate-N-acetylglucosamine-binding protein YvcK [Pseudonocardia parietis]MBP2368652.1 putative cofD-like protein [Pseudonocardia parietis]
MTEPATASPSPLRVVALGGGHGLHATLTALRRCPAVGGITAVVTVADDGGSSGRLRRELGLLPPGDLRMALAALAADDEDGRFWSGLVQHRFGGNGALAGHALGNLLLAGLLERGGDPVQALETVGGLLGCAGRVLPMARVPLDIEAEVAIDGLDHAHRIRGQVAVASTPGRVRRVWLRPENPPACDEAVRAVLDADVVLLGPGSWFTSVLPHLLVPGLRDALLATAAARVVLLNLAPEPGETAGFSPEQHLEVLSGHAPSLRAHAVLADTGSVPLPDRLHAAAADLLVPGGRVWLADVADVHAATPRHDPNALAGALLDVFDALGPAGSADGGAGSAPVTDQHSPQRGRSPQWP